VQRFRGRPDRYAGAGEERIELAERADSEIPTCSEYVDHYLREYARRHKASSLHVQTCRLRRFREDFAAHSLDLSRSELKQWVEGEGPWSERGPIPKSQIPAIISLYNHAIDEDDLPLARSPARKLTWRYKDRVDQPPPSSQEFEALVAACSALGDYGSRMRALLLFAAYTLMRPSELYALEWADIDFGRMRIRKTRRVYRGTVEEPKTGPKLIALTPPARDAIKRLPRNSKLVFTSKRGKRLTPPTFSGYWHEVLTAAGLKFDFYHATKHYGVHYMWTKLRLSPRAIAAQAGWKLDNANRMLAVYGHGEVGALKEVDASFYRPVGFPGRAIGERLDSWQSRAVR
jgi:integrase